MGGIDRNRVAALFWLAVTFWVHLFSRLRARLARGGPPPLETFRSHYRDDGIWHLEPPDRAAMPALGECVSCRVCDSVCPPLHAEEGRGFVGPARLVMANHRLLPAVATWIDPFLCIRCRACDDACPQGVEIDRLVGAMRRAVAREAPGLVPAELGRAAERVAAHGHLAGEPPPAPRREGTLRADYTYIASCAAGAADVEAETALLAKAGVDFASAPPICCGGFGFGATGEMPAGLRAALDERRALNLVTGDGRCLEHLRAHPAYKDLAVYHVLEVAADVAAAAAPAGEKAEAPKVTYHDPCQLARVAGGTVFPREAIRRAGAELVEMAANGRAAPCCGMAGGTHAVNPELAEALGRARIRQALETGAGLLLTQSPLCRDHLARAAALEGAALEVRNVTEFLAERSGALPARAEEGEGTSTSTSKSGEAEEGGSG